MKEKGETHQAWPEAIDDWLMKGAKTKTFGRGRGRIAKKRGCGYFCERQDQQGRRKKGSVLLRKK